MRFLFRIPLRISTAGKHNGKLSEINIKKTYKKDIIFHTIDHMQVSMGTVMNRALPSLHGMSHNYHYSSFNTYQLRNTSTC